MSDNPSSQPMHLRNKYWLLRHGRSLANEAEIIVSSLENGVSQKWTLSPTGLLQAEAAGHLLVSHLNSQHKQASDSAVIAPHSSSPPPDPSHVSGVSLLPNASSDAAETDTKTSTMIVNSDAGLSVTVVAGASVFLDQGALINSSDRLHVTAPAMSLQDQHAAASSAAMDDESVQDRPSNVLHFVYTSPFSRTILTAQTAAGIAGMNTTGSSFRVAVELRERFFGSDLELQPYAAAYGQIWEHDEVNSAFCPGGGDGESVEDVANRIRLLFKRLEEEHCEGVSNILLVSHGDTLSILQATMQGPAEAMGLHRRFAFETAELRQL